MLIVLVRILYLWNYVTVFVRTLSGQGVCIDWVCYTAILNRDFHTKYTKYVLQNILIRLNIPDYRTVRTMATPFNHLMSFCCDLPSSFCFFCSSSCCRRALSWFLSSISIWLPWTLPTKNNNYTLVTYETTNKRQINNP